MVLSPIQLQNWKLNLFLLHYLISEILKTPTNTLISDFPEGKSSLWREGRSGEKDSGILVPVEFAPVSHSIASSPSCILGFWRREAATLLSGIACLNKRSVEVLSFGNLAWDTLPSVCKHLDTENCPLWTQSHCLCWDCSCLKVVWGGEWGGGDGENGPRGIAQLGLRAGELCCCLFKQPECNWDYLRCPRCLGKWGKGDGLLREGVTSRNFDGWLAGRLSASWLQTSGKVGPSGLTVRSSGLANRSESMKYQS